jgi:ABC-type transporter Mla subunit MlaD
MRIKTPYELKIPSDGTASLSSEGVLGPTFVDIDTRNTHGPSLGNSGTLKSLDIGESKSLDSLVGAIGNALIQASHKDKESAEQPDHSGPKVNGK